MKRKGFTLIELLAVIIILGILMLIAIPSVTSYINNSRKETYADSIQEVIKAAVTKVNSGEIDMFDTDTTYYIPVSSLKLENGEMKSPYGDMKDAYVVVTFDGDDYDYYFVGKDETNMGVDELTNRENISRDSIESGVGDIPTNVGITGKANIVVFDDDLVPSAPTPAVTFVSGNGSSNAPSGTSTGMCTGDGCLCKRATQIKTSVCDNEYGCGYNLMYDYQTTSTFGKLGSGNPSLGDAYDCDVNGDGVYNSTTERFYFIRTYNGISSLIAGKNYDTQIQYNENGRNNDGPVTAAQYLPTTSVWINEKLIPPAFNRNIIGDLHYVVEEPFNYGSSAARFLTLDELEEIGDIVVDARIVNLDPIKNPQYAFFYDGYMEGPEYIDYWLETPSNISDYDVYTIDSDNEDMLTRAEADAERGIRPVIDVEEHDIEH